MPPISIPLEEVPDTMLRELFTSEQIPLQRYLEETRRREAVRATFSEQTPSASATDHSGGDHG